jgi:hypothetical protein
MTKTVQGTFAFSGEEPQTVSTEVTGTLSEALLGFRQSVMEHLTSYLSANAAEKTAVDANEDAFADNDEVEEDNVEAYLKGKKGGKRQKV